MNPTWLQKDIIINTPDVSTVKAEYDIWGYDERHPENRLPYADTLKYLSIPDMATMRAAMCTGKIDFIPGGRGSLTWHEAKSLSKTDPEIRQSWLKGFSGELMLGASGFYQARWWIDQDMKK